MEFIQRCCSVPVCVFPRVNQHVGGNPELRIIENNHLEFSGFSIGVLVEGSVDAVNRFIKAMEI
jgi:hypothetical protein